jgi:hypothetical protein
MLYLVSRTMASIRRISASSLSSSLPGATRSSYPPARSMAFHSRVSPGVMLNPSRSQRSRMRSAVRLVRMRKDSRGSRALATGGVQWNASQIQPVMVSRGAGPSSMT